MTQDALLKAIEDDALAEKAVLLKEAEEAVSAIMQQARAESTAWKEKRIALVKVSLANKKAGLLGAARVRANALKLRLRRSLAKEVLEEAAKLLEASQKGERQTLINRFYNELKAEWVKAGLAPGDTPTALVNPLDVGLIKADGNELKGDGGIGFGVVFISKDGKTRFENTINGRMKRAAKALEVEVDSILFNK
jgi:vacuolar-type H+-ATPase subunit E/Vma4